jgi:hypothetical protein
MGEKKENSHAVALSKLGAKRAEDRGTVLLPEQRREIAPTGGADDVGVNQENLQLPFVSNSLTTK